SSTSTVPSSRRGMYGSSGMPIRTSTSRPSGSLAGLSTRFERRLIRCLVPAASVSETRWPFYARAVIERVVHFPARTVFTVLAIVLSVAAALEVLWISRHVLSWIFISLFLAMALNPAVEWLQRHRVPRRGLAVGITYLGVAIVVAGLGATFVP